MIWKSNTGKSYGEEIEKGMEKSVSKKNNDYFALIQKQLSYSSEAVRVIEAHLESAAADMSACHGQMQQLTKRSDDLYRDILYRLATEFITPIDQEDILRSVQSMKAITYALAEAAQDIHIYRIRQIPERAEELLHIAGRCVQALEEAAKELKNFKKPEILWAKLCRVKNIGNEAESVYAAAVCALLSKTGDDRVLLGSKAICEDLKKCCILCVHTTEVLEQIIIKNT